MLDFPCIMCIKYITDIKDIFIMNRIDIDSPYKYLTFIIDRVYMLLYNL